MPNKSIKIFTMILLYSTMTWAQVGPKLEIVITDNKINPSQNEQTSGEVIYTPGDTIEYVLTSKNVGDAVMTEPVIVDPIPAGVTYIPKSAEGKDAQILFSIDGGTSFEAWPLYYSVRNSRGIIVKREATPEMYTHIKWEIDTNLQPGMAHNSKFKVMVNS